MPLGGRKYGFVGSYVIEDKAAKAYDKAVICLEKDQGFPFNHGLLNFPVDEYDVPTLQGEGFSPTPQV